MEVIRKDDPLTLVKYAAEKGLIYQKHCKCGKIYVRNKKMLHRIYHNPMKAKKGVKSKFLI